MWFSVFFLHPQKDLYLGAFGTWNQEMSAKELLDQRKVDKCHSSSPNHGSWVRFHPKTIELGTYLAETIVQKHLCWLFQQFISIYYTSLSYFISILYHMYIYILFIIFIPFNSIPLIGSGDDRWLRKWTLSHEMFHKKHDSFLSSRHSCLSIPMKPQFSEGISPWNQPFWWFISCVLWV